MRKSVLLMAAGISFAGAADAAPVFRQAGYLKPALMMENVRLVCRENGRCRRGPPRAIEPGYYHDVYAYLPTPGFYGPGYGGPAYYPGRPVAVVIGSGRW